MYFVIQKQEPEVLKRLMKKGKMEWEINGGIGAAAVLFEYYTGLSW